MNARAVMRGPARWPLGLAVLLSVAALVTLFWLRGRLAREEGRSLENVVNVFERTGAIGRPEDDSVRFSNVESLARTQEDRDFISKVVVTKNVLGKGERVLHPWSLELLNPGWRDSTHGWERLPIGNPDSPDGWLYAELDPVNRRAVDRAIGAFSVLLVLCLTMLIIRQWGKEMELGQTISELEERRAEVIRLERLALAGQLSANILHDLKKPVLNIKHEVSDSLGSGAPPQAETLRAVREQTDLFLTMLRELGYEQFVRAGAEQSEYCDVRELTERSLALVKYERGDVRVHLEFPETGGLPDVFAPPHRLIQLFSNLFLNSFQAMSGRGELWVGVAARAEGVELTVEDSGPGIPPAVRSGIFDPFSTTKADTGGSGLGLYICSKIVADLGGVIELAAAKHGSGACFRVLIPAPERR
ncbi:HAMP domain-containing histidine kinase [Candidatus Poribacteria bacterium]|nr:HAMP domain-containing histidine kinase [Candidatus Poribacteria bacterium]